MYRCPQCRTRRKFWVDLVEHTRTAIHGVCRCGGYHYPHRPDSPCCEDNKLHVLNSAIRAGATRAEIEDIRLTLAVDWIFEHPPTTEPPF